MMGGSSGVARWPTLLIWLVSICVLVALGLTALMPFIMGMENEPFERWYGNWTSVLGAVGLFVAFLLGFVRPRGSPGWKATGMGTAFFIALFTEMFGIPLTIYFLSGLIGGTSESFGLHESHLWAFFLDHIGLIPLQRGVYLVMVISVLLIGGGIVLAACGWRRVYLARGGLVTDGLYAVIRHPQYAGFFLVIIGFLIQWPTILTLIMAPVLLVMYSRLARREEEGLRSAFGDAYEIYRARVPRFIPGWASGRRRRAQV